MQPRCDVGDGHPSIFSAILGVGAVVACAFILAWPLFGGMIAINDDIKFIRVPAHSQPITKQIATAWTSSPSFRPLEILVAAGCDERTLACPTVMPVQAIGMALLIAAVFAIARITLPNRPWVAPIALMWISISPSTTFSLWQMDACSQTWSAALGSWAFVLCWRSLLAAKSGRIAWRFLALLTLVMLIGVNIKETFYGWSAGIGIVFIGALLRLLVTDRNAALRGAIALLPVVALPLAHAFLRWRFGGLLHAPDSAVDSRYTMELGMNLFNNAVHSIAGSIGTGSFALLVDDHAPWVLRGLPILAALAELALLVAVVEFCVLHHGRQAWLRYGPVAAFLAAAFISLGVTLPMSSVSELYSFGANVSFGVLLGVVITELWNEPSVEAHRITRAVAVICGSMVLSIGLYGLVCRAQQSHHLWKCAAAANEQIISFMDSRPDPKPYQAAPMSILLFEEPYRMERSYGAFIMPTAQALAMIHTMEWMNQLHPRHITTMSYELPSATPTPYELLIDCNSMSKANSW